MGYVNNRAISSLVGTGSTIEWYKLYLIGLLMDMWQDFMREEIRRLVFDYSRQSGKTCRESWHVLYDAYVERGGTLPDAKNKLKAFDVTALEAVLTVAKTI